MTIKGTEAFIANYCELLKVKVLSLTLETLESVAQSQIEWIEQAVP